MGGLQPFMKITYATFLIATLAISGFPLMSGFFSKDEILLTAFNHNIVLYAIGSLASVMTAFYMFRLFFLTFKKGFRGTQEQKNHLHESPASMTTPLIILATLSIFGGLISLPNGYSWLNEYLKPVIVNTVTAHGHDLGVLEYSLMGVATIGFLIGLGLAFNKYIQKSEVPQEDEQIVGFHKILYNKYYIDEIYQKAIVNPIYNLATFLRDVVEVALSGTIFGLGKIADGLSLQGKKAQNGNIGLYLFAFVFGICLILYYLFIAR